MPKPVIAATKNTSVQLVCEAPGESLNLCVWERMIGGERHLIVIDRQQDEGSTSADGTENYGGRLAAGRCGLKIDALKDTDFSEWNCTLVTNGGQQVLAGTVDVIDLGMQLCFQLPCLIKQRVRSSQLR